MNKAHVKTFAAIFARPTSAAVKWPKVVALLRALGADVGEGAGSRVRFSLNGVDATFHRPHPGKELRKYAVEDMRDFLEKAGVTP